MLIRIIKLYFGIMLQCFSRIIEFKLPQYLYQQKMNSQFTQHHQLIAYLNQCTWKQKINFFNQITLQISQGELQLPPRIIEQSCLQLLNERNINTLLKIIECLKHFTQHYTLNSLRLQKQMIKKLLSLTKMKKKQIDNNVVQIICQLIKKDKQASNPNTSMTIRISSIQLFSKVNNPTFLFGANQDQNIGNNTEDDSMVTISPTALPSSNSHLLLHLIQIMKGCRRQFFDVILEVVSQLLHNSLLSLDQSKIFYQQIMNIKDVILKRRNTEQHKNQELELKVQKTLQEIKGTNSSIN